jgi:hypothetical protein
LRFQARILSRVPATATLTYNPFPAANRALETDRRVTSYDFQDNLELLLFLAGSSRSGEKPKIDNTYFNDFSQRNAMRAEY